VQELKPFYGEDCPVVVVAEAAALAACGPKARLILPRIVVGKVTCALAESGEAP
jgi:hypothetical protein